MDYAPDPSGLPRPPVPEHNEARMMIGMHRLVGVCPECGMPSFWTSLVKGEPRYAVCWVGFQGMTSCSYFEPLADWLANPERRRETEMRWNTVLRDRYMANLEELSRTVQTM